MPIKFGSLNKSKMFLNLYGKSLISFSKNRFSQKFLFLTINTWKLNIYLQQCFIDIGPINEDPIKSALPVSLFIFLQKWLAS